MPVFIEDPTQLSKSRLLQDLINHNVALPPPESKKEVYVELYLKHIDQRNAADFSSDEEDQTQPVDEGNEEEEDSEMLDPSELTDEELKLKLLAYGVQPGPIVGSTRALYERKLKKLQQADVQLAVNGEGDAAQYSDSEEEEGEEEEPASEPAEEEKTAEVDENQEESNQMESRRSLTSSAERERERRGSCEQEHVSSFQRKVQMVDSYTMTNQSLNNSPVAVLSKQQIKEAVKDVLEEMFKETAQTPTGISATRRRPIKGAAGRPVQYKYPDTPLSPAFPVTAPPSLTQEAQRRLVPLWVQVLVFLVVACLLFLIYAYVLDVSTDSIVALLDNLSLESESEEALSPQADTGDAPVLD